MGKEQGRAIPEIQFFERGRENPVSLAYMSSGVHQVLTLLTDLIGRDGLVIFIEHPEQHLHPHAARFVLSLMREAAERNQVIVSTHDVHFVTPDTFQGFRRFWWTAEGTQVFGPPAALLPGANQKAIEALRHLGNREMLFARAVLLVEDQTLQDFFLAVAPTLGYGLDVSGVSVIAVDGEGNFKPFRECLGALGIPFCSVRDQAWDNEERFPSARFFSFGMEIEQYLDEHGLAGEREKVAGARGMTKRKAAAALAPQLTK
ncbi:MAG: AAA family ATPase, partial [Chloroflexi bacterium]|nr:AAA family ATPase [Chloroflexota bacterium]